MERHKIEDDMNKLLGGRELARFSKNSNEDVAFTLNNWGVGRYLDIRAWSKIRVGDSTPSTPKSNGFKLDLGLLPDLMRALNQAIVGLGRGEGLERAWTLTHAPGGRLKWEKIPT